MLFSVLAFAPIVYRHCTTSRINSTCAGSIVTAPKCFDNSSRGTHDALDSVGAIYLKLINLKRRRRWSVWIQFAKPHTRNTRSEFRAGSFLRSARFVVDPEKERKLGSGWEGRSSELAVCTRGLWLLSAVRRTVCRAGRSPEATLLILCMKHIISPLASSELMDFASSNMLSDNSSRECAPAAAPTVTPSPVPRGTSP
jgi:hypothetical protein